MTELKEMPDRCTQAIRRVEKRDIGYFKHRPHNEKYLRAYVYGEFWPMDVPLGTPVQVTHVGDNVCIRHALCDKEDVTAFPGYEEEAEFFKQNIAHLTDKDVARIVHEIRRESNG